jgi:hypothetical protein
MPAGTVSISANGVGAAGAGSIASLIAYAALHFIFPGLGGSGNSNCDIGAACRALTALHSDGHDRAFDDYEDLDPYYDGAGDYLSPGRVSIEADDVTKFIRTTWLKFVETSGVLDNWWGPALIGFIASYVPGALRRWSRGLWRRLEEPDEVRPRAGSGRYNLALQNGSGW